MSLGLGFRLQGHVEILVRALAGVCRSSTLILAYKVLMHLGFLGVQG